VNFFRVPIRSRKHTPPTRAPAPAASPRPATPSPLPNKSSPESAVLLMQHRVHLVLSRVRCRTASPASAPAAAAPASPGPPSTTRQQSQRNKCASVANLPIVFNSPTQSPHPLRMHSTSRATSGSTPRETPARTRTPPPPPALLSPKLPEIPAQRQPLVGHQPAWIIFASCFQPVM